jgi:hypothetical protein
MNRFFAMMLASALGGSAFGQGVSILYSPVRTIKDQNIALRSWGSGTISETDEAAFEGTHSLRISTRNYFQGGMIGFGAPVDLSRAYEDKNNLLRFSLMVPDSGTTFGGGGAAGGGGAVGGGLAGGGGAVGGGLAGGDLSGGGGGARGGGLAGGGGREGGGAMGGGGQGAPTVSVPPLQNIRLIITTTDGKRSEAYLPVSTAAGTQNWRQVAIPLQAVTGFNMTNKVVKEIAIAGDTTTTMYVGDLRVINDATPIRAEVNHRTLNLALGDEVDLIGFGQGGSSVLRYSWDFDATDGIQEEAEGQAIRRRFRKPGTYVVTLTVSDKYGLKAPFSTTIQVTVNP